MIHNGQASRRNALRKGKTYAIAIPSTAFVPVIHTGEGSVWQNIPRMVTGQSLPRRGIVNHKRQIGIDNRTPLVAIPFFVSENMHIGHVGRKVEFHTGAKAVHGEFVKGVVTPRTVNLKEITPTVITGVGVVILYIPL